MEEKSHARSRLLQRTRNKRRRERILAPRREIIQLEVVVHVRSTHVS